jgi:hypothetical protein
MRVIEVEAEERSDRWLLWLLAGTAVGITAGVLVANKFGGRRPNLGGLGKRMRGLARAVSGQWGPLVDVALELKDQWNERRAARPIPADAAHDGEEYEDDYEDADEYEAATDALDLDTDDDFDDFDADEDSEIGARVLEAYLNDPVLAERMVEIEADDEGGEVLLLGSVRSAKEIAHAVTLARGVPGVTNVRQQLTVRSRR